MKARRRKKIKELVDIYCQCHELLGFSGTDPNSIKVKFDPNGPDAVEAFDLNDTLGIAAPLCSEPDKYARARHGKMCLNFHIAMWSDGPDWPPIFELRVDLEFLPEWVWRAVIQSRYNWMDENRKAV